MNLPAGSAGNIVSVVKTIRILFKQIALTIAPNGSQKINGGEGSICKFRQQKVKAVTFVYVD